MFSKKSLHISLAFILLIALATLGLAYGAWTDSLQINGEVTTGSLNVDFIGTDGGVADTDPYNLVTCYLDYEDDLITITITGAYPGYQCNPQILVKNTGSVPAVATMNFPASEPVQHVYVGGVLMGNVPLAPGAQVGFTLPIEVYLNPPMNTPVTFSFPIPVVQAP
jgi:hypothetical protein